VIEAGILFESMNSILDKEISRLNTENEAIDIQIKGLTQKLPVIPESVLSNGLDIAELQAPLEEDVKGEENLYVDTMTHEEVVFPEEVVLSEDEILSEEEVLLEEEIQSEEEVLLEEEIQSEEEVLSEEEIQLEEEPTPDKLSLSEEIFAAASDSPVEEITMDEKVSLGEEIRSLSNTVVFDKVMVKDLAEKEISEESLETEKDRPEPLSLSDDQKAIFSYFMPVKGMESQLCKALAGVVENLKGTPTSSVGNLIIQGSQGCGKTVLAKLAEQYLSNLK